MLRARTLLADNKEENNLVWLLVCWPLYQPPTPPSTSLPSSSCRFEPFQPICNGDRANISRCPAAAINATTHVLHVAMWIVD
ncbi:hypothetical protein ACLKA7_008672 [Drosophila subpalustris]